MVLAGVRAHPDVDAALVHAIDVVRVVAAVGVAVLERLGIQPDRHAARDGANQRVGRPRVGDAEHDDVDAAGFRVEQRQQPVRVAVVGRQVELGRDGVRGRIGAQPGDRIGVEGVDGVDPDVVEPPHQALDDVSLVREVNRFVLILHVRDLVDVFVGAVVGARELDDVLPGEDHPFPVRDIAERLVQHRDAGVLELLQLRRVGGLAGVGARVHDDADRDAGLPALDDLVRIARVGHEPEAQVDADRLLLDESQHVVAAAFVGDIADVSAAGAAAWLSRLRGRERRCQAGQGEDRGGNGEGESFGHGRGALGRYRSLSESRFEEGAIAAYLVITTAGGRRYAKCLSSADGP